MTDEASDGSGAGGCEAREMEDDRNRVPVGDGSGGSGCEAREMEDERSRVPVTLVGDSSEIWEGRGNWCKEAPGVSRVGGKGDVSIVWVCRGVYGGDEFVRSKVGDCIGAGTA
jgi:hypothetical protein